MADDGQNGEAKTPEPSELPVEGEIRITISLIPGPAGYLMRLDHPPTIFRETVVDACMRVARWYGHLELLDLMASRAKAGLALQEEVRNLERLRGRGLLG
jgi:hypothetical protein